MTTRRDWTFGQGLTVTDLRSTDCDDLRRLKAAYDEGLASGEGRRRGANQLLAQFKKRLRREQRDEGAGCKANPCSE